jgi:hypothetical protein
MERKNTWPFKFPEKGVADDGKVYEGTFTSKIASFMDRTRIDVRTSELAGGMYTCRDEDGRPDGRGISEQTELNCKIIATLETCLIQKPVWFKLEGDEAVVDEDLIFSLYLEVRKYERRFRGLPDKPVDETVSDGGLPQSSQGSSSAQPPETNPGVVPQKVVGREVQAALDP